MPRNESDRRIIESSRGVFSPIVFSRLLQQEPHFTNGDHLTQRGRREIRKRVYIITHHSLAEARLNATCRKDRRIFDDVKLRKGLLEALVETPEPVI
ncbi:MAG TPA: hypothetical protein VM077_05340 [Candidatus Limnocylindrales bacterium]|nr:hypothetical protein [Candidatus Limnocylindrales bacterium]